MPKQNEPRKPAHTIRSGNLSVSIWANESTNGTWYAGNVQRSYTENDGKDWKYSDSFGRDDLPLAARLLEMAHTWIVYTEGKAHAAKGGGQ